MSGEPEGLEDEHLRGLVDHIPAMVAFWDEHLRNVVANQAYVRWFGFSPQELHGMHIKDVLGPSLYKANLPYIEGALAGRRQQFDRTLVTTEGETRHTQAEYIPDVTAEGVKGFYVLVADTTEKVQAQQHLLATQELARVGSFSIDPATRTLHVSRELVQRLGFDPGGPEITREAYIAAVHPEDADVVRDLWTRALRGEADEAIYRFVRPDGAVRHLRSRTSQVRGPEDEIVLMRGVMQDVTEVQAMAAELGATNRLLTDMIAMLGHDLGQPVGAVTGFLEILEQEWDVLNDPERRALTARASRAGRRVERLMRDLLTLANVESSELATRTSAVDVVATIREAAHAQQVPIDIVGGSCTSAHVLVDPLHLDRMVDNLISNAARYGLAPFRVLVVRDGGQVVVSLRDHGPGVPRDFVPHLFERFTRAQTGVAAMTSGTGFGLYLVRRLAEANDGAVEHHAPGDGPGAVFELRLPVAPRQPARSG